MQREVWRGLPPPSYPTRQNQCGEPLVSNRPKAVIRNLTYGHMSVIVSCIGHVSAFDPYKLFGLGEIFGRATGPRASRSGLRPTKEEQPA